MIDSGRLAGGPLIGCFRCGERIKIIWNSSCQLDSGISIWTSPGGEVEMLYQDFVNSVTDFLDSFFKAMDEQVQKAAARDWGNISLDKERLVREHQNNSLVRY